MLVVGLTGSIAMGKSETARMFARLGFPVFDADEVVHRLYDTGGAAVSLIAREFPGAVVDGKVDRTALADRVTGDPDALARLEAIVHPLVRREQQAFLAAARDAGHGLAVLDIPAVVRDRARPGCRCRGRRVGSGRCAEDPRARPSRDD
jgi:dephospho-CoA kinase